MNFIYELIEALMVFFYNIGIETRAREHVESAVLEYKEKTHDKGAIVSVTPDTKVIEAPPLPKGASDGVKALWGTTGIQSTGKLIIRREKDVN